MMSLVLFVLGGILATTEGGCTGGKQILKSGGLSAFEKQAIVDAHNRLRQSVALGQVSSQPPAANMMEMTWDEELAATAQRWSDQCTTAHDTAAERDVSRFPVGQNLAATWTTRPPSQQGDTEPDFLKQINAWFDEVRLFGFKPISGGHSTGHYSQLVWGETSKVGCGFTFYYDPVRGYTKLYVCNYGPGGNVIGAYPYEKGYASCSNYGFTDSNRYSGLCSSGYSVTSSYQTDNNYISNVIPGSTGAAQYDYQYNNQYYNQYQNQYQNQNQYQYQYQQPDPYYTPVASSTFRPFISIFKRATNLLANSKPQVKFGTIFS